MLHKPEPLVGGEPARLILDTIRSFPLSVGYDGNYVVHNTAVGVAREALDRAYGVIELEVLTEAHNCADSAAHKTLDVDEYRHLVLSALAWRAKQALGDMDRAEALWLG